jgi:class 3 adenylate cyclase
MSSRKAAPQSVEPYGAQPTPSGSFERDGLFSVLRTLFSKRWRSQDYDRTLREALNDSLNIVHAVGIVAHIAERDVTMACFRPELDEISMRDRVTSAVEAEVARQYSSSGNQLACREAIPFCLDDTLSGMVMVVPTEGESLSQVLAQREVKLNIDYCAMVYEVEGKWRGHWADQSVAVAEHVAAEWDGVGEITLKLTQAERAQQQFITFHGRSTLAMLFHVMLYRESRFTPFPGLISQRYWEDSVEFMKADGEPRRTDALRPPWDTGELRRTATLSFDLRKSTFCMEHADNHAKFGDWLDQLVEILTMVCHMHGGVFDKFTGDGALVHFLEREFEVVYSHKDPVEAAMDCAVDMHRAINIHLERLREFLRFDCRLLGAGIAIDISDTYWALDHRDNPITVGRGVVGACRLCDKTKAGKIHMTNIAFKALKPDVLKKLPQPKTVDLESKELDRDMEVTVWEFTMPCDPPELELGSQDKIASLCTTVYRRMTRDL